MLYATGIDINEVLLDKTLGNKIDIREVLKKRNEAASGYICFYLPEGVVTSISGIQELKNLPYVKMICIEDIRIGQKTEPMLHKGMRKGPILVTGKDRNDIEENIRKVQETLQINVRCTDGSTKGIIWN